MRQLMVQQHHYYYCSDIIIHRCQIIQQLLGLCSYEHISSIATHTHTPSWNPAHLFIFHVAVLFGCHENLPPPIVHRVHQLVNCNSGGGGSKCGNKMALVFGYKISFIYLHLIDITVSFRPGPGPPAAGYLVHFLT